MSLQDALDNIVTFKFDNRAKPIHYYIETNNIKLILFEICYIVYYLYDKDNVCKCYQISKYAVNCLDV